MKFDSNNTERSKKVDLHRATWASFHFDGNTFEVRTEPGAQAMKYPVPNQITGRYNPAFDVTYLGDMNEADMTVADATLNVTGPMWKMFDVANTCLSFNYLGLGIDPSSQNVAYNNQFKATMLESLSAAYASQFTNLAFMQQGIETDIPGITGVFNNKFDGSGQIGFTVFYQSVVQTVAAVFAKYNTLLSYADYLIQLGYNYEAPYTTQLLNLFKKQNVYSLFDQLGTIMQQEYLDLGWYRESTVLNTLISKADQGIQTPNMSIVANHRIPHVRVHTGSSNVAANDIIFSTFPEDATGSDADAYAQKFNDITIYKSNVTIHGDLETLAMTIMQMMDIETILEWARNVQSGNIPITGENAYTSEKYINEIIKNVHSLIDVLSAFRTATVDFKTFLMVLQSQTNLNKWMIGTPYLAPSYPRVQRQPAYFKVIDDIFTAMAMGGPLIYDETSRKWKVITPWFNSVGINGYDAYDGGFAIATSVRQIPTDSDYTITKYLFPVMFGVYKQRIYSNGAITATVVEPEFLNRIGATFEISPVTITAQTLKQNIHFAYVNLTDSDEVTLTMPEARLATYTTDPVTKSTAMKCLLTVYGVGTLVEGSGSTQVSNQVLDPDLIGMVGREFGNFSSDSVNYITGRAPLRQTDRAVNLGFVSSALTRY